MYKNLRWKLLVIGAVILGAAIAIYPPGEKIHLGIDLKGGLHLVLKVQTNDALKAETESTVDQFQQALKDGGIAGATVRVTGLTSFVIESVPPASDTQFRQLADQRVGQTYDRTPGINGSYSFQMKPNVEAQDRRE